jgi:hypothetical protein
VQHIKTRKGLILAAALIAFSNFAGLAAAKPKENTKPRNKNLLKIDGVESELEGVVVYIPNTDKAYIPLQAVHAVTGKKEKLSSVSR